MQDHYREPVTAAVPHAAPVRQKVRWATAGPLLVGALGVALAAFTLAMFLAWKSSEATQISQLQRELTAAQSQAASTSTGLSGLTQRVGGMNRYVAALEGLVGSYTFVCSQDLTGPSGPAVFYFPCQQKG
jgi:hypothetical protein